MVVVMGIAVVMPMIMGVLVIMMIVVIRVGMLVNPCDRNGLGRRCR